MQLLLGKGAGKKTETVLSLAKLGGRGGSISNLHCSILQKTYLYRAGIYMFFAVFVVLNK